MNAKASINGPHCGGQKIKLISTDGYPIAATRFTARSPVKGHIIVAGATGVPQKFYRRFAEYACEKGFSTLTLDYRGIGESKPETLKGFKATYLDWAQLDLAAAVEEMRSDTLPIFMVGHSYGGHALGLLPNHRYVDKFYGFAVGAGWSGWMPLFERIRVQFLWHIVLPVIVTLKGYMAWSKLGMGDDLPIDIYKQWKYWCRFPHYFFDDPTMKEITRLYQDVRTPIVVANALDDHWASPKSRDAFIQGYSNAPVKRLDIDPKKGFGAIGHMGYFKSFAAPLWDDVLAWFMGEQAGNFYRV